MHESVPHGKSLYFADILDGSFVTIKLISKKFVKFRYDRELTRTEAANWQCTEKKIEDHNLAFLIFINIP